MLNIYQGNKNLSLNTKITMINHISIHTHAAT